MIDCRGSRSARSGPLAVCTTPPGASGSGAVTNVYDGFDQLTSTTTTMGGTSRTLSSAYDSNGDRTSRNEE